MDRNEKTGVELLEEARELATENYKDVFKKVRWALVSLACACFVAGGWLFFEQLPENKRVERSAVGSPSKATASVASERRTAESPCAAPVESALPPGVWKTVSRENATGRICATAGGEGSAKGAGVLRNERACISYRATFEDGGAEQRQEGMCPRGETSAHFPLDRPVKRLEARNEETFTVYLKFRYPHP